MLTVRRATEADVEGCVGVLAELSEYFTPVTHDEVRAVLADRGTHLGLVATEGTESTILGFVLVEQRYRGSAELTHAAVLPQHRGKGIGTRLIEQVLFELAMRGVKVVEVKTLDESSGYEPYVATRAFWGARGFVQMDCIDPLPGWDPGNPSAIYVAALEPTTRVTHHTDV